MSDDPRVIICAGPPLCLLEGDDAIAHQESGCEFCKTIIIHLDGTETVVERTLN